MESWFTIVKSTSVLLPTEGKNGVVISKCTSVTLTLGNFFGILGRGVYHKQANHLKKMMIKLS